MRLIAALLCLTLAACQCDPAPAPEAEPELAQAATSAGAARAPVRLEPLPAELEPGELYTVVIKLRSICGGEYFPQVLSSIGDELGRRAEWDAHTNAFILTADPEELQAAHSLLQGIEDHGLHPRAYPRHSPSSEQRWIPGHYENL